MLVPLRRATICVCLLALASPLAAQESLTARDSLGRAVDRGEWRKAYDAGSEAASQQLVGHRAILAFVAGFPLGVGIAASRQSYEPRAWGLVGMSVATVVAAANLGKTEVPQWIMEDPTVWRGGDERAFREGYAERLRSRRAKAAIRGGVAGALLSIALLITVVPET